MSRVLVKYPWNEQDAECWQVVKQARSDLLIDWQWASRTENEPPERLSSQDRTVSSDVARLGRHSTYACTLYAAAQRQTLLAALIVKQRLRRRRFTIGPGFPRESRMVPRRCT